VSPSALSPENASTDPPEDVAAAQADESASPWLLALLLAAITVGAYWPTFSNGFLNYDDNGYVTQNSHLQPGFTLANISWAFRATIMANWHPLTWLSHMADVQFFGLHPAGHHATSLILHVLNVLLLFFLLRAATGFLWRSFFVSALFALHPLNVECVAWISERKSLLCTLFFLLALFAYGWYVRKPGIGRYALVAAMFVLGLLAKPMIVTLPFVLLLLDYWPLNRLPLPGNAGETSQFFKKLWPLALEKLPLLLFSAASAYITVIAQARANTVAVSGTYALPVRLSNALWSYLLYVLKALWPLRLAIFYPHPEGSLPLWKPALGLAAILAATYFCVRHARERYLLAGWLWYLGCMVPVIGVVQVGRQAMADRYAYTPLLGIFLLVVWWVAKHSAKLPHRAELLAGAAAIVLIFFGALSRRQTTYWKDSLTLFNHALQITPVNFIAENNLGEAYLQSGRPDLAYNHFLRATQEKPRYGLAHYNLGIILAQQNRHAEARREFAAGIEFGQDNAEIASSYHNLGIVMIDDRQFTDAIDMFSEALRRTPGKQSSYLARGLAEYRLNNFAAAERDFIAGANLTPDAVACLWVGRAREAQGNTNGAIKAYRQSLAIQPGRPDAKERLDALLSGRAEPFYKSDVD
jgi:tetratricopeptide (TPR) repeat protein